MATLVHDEPNLKVRSMVLMSEELFARSNAGLTKLGRLSSESLADLLACRSFVVVEMEGDRVAETRRVRLFRNA